MVLSQLSHPLDPLSAEEVATVAGVVKGHLGPAELFFQVITLSEPSKAELAPFLDPECKRQDAPLRHARVHVYIGTMLNEFKVDVAAKQIVSRDELPGRHSYIDSEYMKQVERVCLADSGVQREIHALELPQGATVVVEPWTYSPDGLHDIRKRLTMCYFYMRISKHEDANYYAYPLTLCAEVSDALRVVKVYHLPSREQDETTTQGVKFDLQKEHPSSEYHPDLVQSRNTTKPYHVHQPLGPSFKVDGYRISWEKWTFRVGFNYREGMTLHDLRFDGRSTFYRLSLAELFVPYGDPRFPFPRKAAFDIGSDGAGINANNLRLGCDCLGHIKYFDAWHTSRDGTPVHEPHVICCHEIDDGILWKHTNFRTGNAVVARSRLLVLQSVITVDNYEYVFSFYFSQDASIHYEVRATGILSTAPININDTVSFGTIVAPGVLAPYHQHLFCLRIDPAIDGHRNTVVSEETHLLPDESNAFGVGFTTTSQPIPNEAGLDLDVATNRTYKIINEKRQNATNGLPVGYKLVPCYSQMLLARPTSLHAQRSEFGAHAVWVTRYSDDELFPAGKYTMQSQGGEGIASWVQRRLPVRNEDVVLWHTFGSTHIPRIEDWPVMPCEKMVVGLKPVHFFERNPAVDVAAAAQETNRSVLIGDD